MISADSIYPFSWIQYKKSSQSLKVLFLNFLSSWLINKYDLLIIFHTLSLRISFLLKSVFLTSLLDKVSKVLSIYPISLKQWRVLSGPIFFRKSRFFCYKLIWNKPILEHERSIIFFQNKLSLLFKKHKKIFCLS